MYRQVQKFSRSWTYKIVFQVLWRQLTQSGQAWESVEGRGRQLMMLNTPNDICQVETNVDILIMTSTLQTNIHSIKTRAQLICSVPVIKILLWRQVHLTGFSKVGIINFNIVWLLMWFCKMFWIFQIFSRTYWFYGLTYLQSLTRLLNTLNYLEVTPAKLSNLVVVNLENFYEDMLSKKCR